MNFKKKLNKKLRHEKNHESRNCFTINCFTLHCCGWTACDCITFQSWRKPLISAIDDSENIVFGTNCTKTKELEPKIVFLVQVISPTLHNFMPIADYQVFIALFLALATGIFAVRLGVALYK